MVAGPRIAVEERRFVISSRHAAISLQDQIAPGKLNRTCAQRVPDRIDHTSTNKLKSDAGVSEHHRAGVWEAMRISREERWFVPERRAKGISGLAGGGRW